MPVFSLSLLALPKSALASKLVDVVIGSMASAVMLAFVVGLGALHWCCFRLSVPLMIESPARTLLASATRWSCVAAFVMMAASITLALAMADGTGPARTVLGATTALAGGAEVVLAAYLIVARAPLARLDLATAKLWQRSPVRVAWSNTLVGAAISAATVVLRGGTPGSFVLFWLGWLLTAWTLSKCVAALHARTRQAAADEAAVEPRTPGVLSPEADRAGP